MRRSRLLVAPVALVVALAAMSFTASPVAADEHLRNGDFAQGSQFWVPMNAAVGSCNASDGGAAMRLTPTSSVQSRVRQRINGPLATGTYVLTGSIVRTAGAQNLLVSLTPLSADDAVLGEDSETVFPTSSYGSFEIELDIDTSGASAALIDFSVASSSPPTVICIDSLSLQGPPLATATPIPTATPTATSQSTTAAGSPTPTRTPTATPTRTPPPSLTFRNGSFEDGADGWQKFGGELSTTSSPRVSGLSAGVLTSATASTKWAYQTVAIDPLRHYQFSGYLQPGPGIASGLLRISWYASPDGTGEAISTTDSTTSVTATSGGYIWLTTGPVQPPPAARTARPRVVLAPAGAAGAALFMDDLEFVAVDPATPTVTPPAPTAPPSLQPAPTLAPRVLSAPNTAAVVETPVVSPEPTRVSEVSSTRVVATPPPVSQVSGVRTEAGSDDEGGLPLIWIVAAAAFVAGLGGAYLQGRRRT